MPPILGKDSIILSPLRRRTEVYEPNLALGVSLGSGKYLYLQLEPISPFSNPKVLLLFLNYQVGANTYFVIQAF